MEGSNPPGTTAGRPGRRGPAGRLRVSRAAAGHRAVVGVLGAAVQAALASDGIELRGGAADEAPLAYKRLDEVLAAHADADAVEILHRLVPIGVAMAPADTVDPYKD